MSKNLNISNESRFGKLVVTSFHHSDSKRRKYYNCKCDCGTLLVVHGSAMISGNTRSCGCLYKDAANARRIPNSGGCVNNLILQYKRHAKNRGIPFKLERHQFDSLIRLPCHYCGNPHGNFKTTKNDLVGLKYNGIDRLNSKLPYVFENCVPCCGVCNFAKGSMSEGEFIAWILRVVKHKKLVVE